MTAARSREASQVRSPAPLLSVRDLTVEFATEYGPVRAVDAVSFDLAPGETLGVVGESGCGKTVMALALLGLVPSPPGRIAGGRALFDDRDLLALSERELRRISGRDICMIFQEPMTALNPVFTIGNQITEVLRRHAALSRRAARSRAVELLAMVGMPSPARRLEEYPHQLSGGQRQRVMIGMALACGPRLLIADEPTTALDVTTQAQVLEQIVALQAELGTAMMLITHDFGVIAESCRRALVMYCGSVVEDAPVDGLFARPRHPYSAGLLSSVPRIREHRLSELPGIPGMVPDLHDLPAGCRFADRCPRVSEQCRTGRPALERDPATGRGVACHHPL